MKEQILFIGPVANHGGPAIKNRIMTEHLKKSIRLRICNTYNRSVLTRIRTVFELLTTRQKFVIIAVSRKGRNLLYPVLILKQKLSGIRFCCVVIGGNVKESFRLKTSARAMLKADLVTLETQRLVRDIRETFHATNTYWLPNYKELSLNEAADKNDKTLMNRPLRFLFLSSMRNVKGVKTLLRAFQRVLAEGAQAELDFYGPIRKDLDTELLDEIEKSANIRYCGAVENDQVLRVMHSYHVFVFPTEYTGEGFPAVLVEAMAAGLPIIASDMNDNPEIVQDKRNGWIFPRGDIAQLSDRIRYCIRNHDVLWQIASNNKTDAMQYDAEYVLSGFESTLRRKGWPV